MSGPGSCTSYFELGAYALGDLLLADGSLGPARRRAALRSRAPTVHEPLGILPGRGIGAIAIGHRWRRVEPSFGPGKLVAFRDRLAVVAHPEVGVEVALASTAAETVTDDAYVIALAASVGGAFFGPARPGLARAVLVQDLGEPEIEEAGTLFYTRGLRIELDADGVAERIAVLAPFDLDEDDPAPLDAFA